MRDQGLFLARLWAQEDELVRAGLPAIPGTWWRDEIERFYRSGKRRWVIRKGRRVFASTAVAPRLAVAEALFGEHRHIPGTPPLVYAFVSIKREEADDRLVGVVAALDALGVRYSKAGQTIHLLDHPATLKVVTASHRTSVGQTVAFAWLDEVSRWNDDKLGRNPAEEVVAAIAPALTTLPDAKMFLVSSPLTTADFHACEYDEAKKGDELRHWAFGTTWDINPEFSEEATRREETNHRKWLREYAAQPQDGIEEDWFGDAACDPTFTDDEAFWRDFGIRNGMRPVFTIDPAFANDYFGYAVVTSEPANDGTPRRLSIVQQSGAIKPEGKPRDMLEWVKGVFLKASRDASSDNDGRVTVYTDQAEFYSLREVAQQLNISLQLVTWTGGEHEKSKATRFRAVRTAMRGGEVRIRRAGELYRQFRSVAGVLLPSGNERIEYKRSGAGHCDELSAAMMGLSVALEMPATAARPVVPVRLADNPDEWRAKAEREVNERRAREWKRSPQAVLRRAMR